MSTLKVDKVVSSIAPLPVVDGARDVQAFVATQGQTQFTVTKFNSDHNIRVFVGLTEVQCSWTGANTVTVSSTTVSAGAVVRVYKVGYSVAEIKGATSNYEVKSANFTAAVNKRYWIENNSTVTLPSAAVAAKGSYVELTKKSGATPVIQTTDGTQILVGALSDTSVTFNTNARLLVMFNGTAWEI